MYLSLLPTVKECGQKREAPDLLPGAFLFCGDDDLSPQRRRDLRERIDAETEFAKFNACDIRLFHARQLCQVLLPKSLGLAGCCYLLADADTIIVKLLRCHFLSYSLIRMGPYTGHGPKYPHPIFHLD
jgi:hypothetical protein